jgi:hypothetical protein
MHPLTRSRNGNLVELGRIILPQYVLGTLEDETTTFTLSQGALKEVFLNIRVTFQHEFRRVQIRTRSPNHHPRISGN